VRRRRHRIDILEHRTDRGSAICDAEPAKEIRDVLLSGRGTDAQPGGDLFVGRATRDELDDLALPRSETRGFGAVAFASVTALTAVSQGLATVISPAIATLFGAGADARIRTAYARGARLLLFFALPLTAAALALGPAAIRIVYGEAYRASGSVVLILLAPLPLIPVVHLGRAFMTGLGRLKASFVMSAFAAVVNIALDFALIPGHAAIGAAIANSSAQVLAGVPVLVYMARHIGGVDWRAGPIMRGMLASGGGGLVAWGVVHAVGGPTGLVAGLLAGALVFAALGRILRILPADDALWLAAALGERAGGRVGRAVRLFAGLPESGGAS